MPRKFSFRVEEPTNYVEKFTGWVDNGNREFNLVVHFKSETIQRDYQMSVANYLTSKEDAFKIKNKVFYGFDNVLITFELVEESKFDNMFKSVIDLIKKWDNIFHKHYEGVEIMYEEFCNECEASGEKLDLEDFEESTWKERLINGDLIENDRD